MKESFIILTVSRKGGISRKPYNCARCFISSELKLGRIYVKWQTITECMGLGTNTLSIIYHLPILYMHCNYDDYDLRQTSLHAPKNSTQTPWNMQRPSSSPRYCAL